MRKERPDSYGSLPWSAMYMLSTILDGIDMIASVYFSLQWRRMSVMMFQITGDSVVCSKRVQASNKGSIKTPYYWSLWEEPPLTNRFPSHEAGDTGSFSIPWRHLTIVIYFFILHTWPALRLLVNVTNVTKITVVISKLHTYEPKSPHIVAGLVRSLLTMHLVALTWASQDEWVR